jgi:hypothetical protein
MMGTEEIFLSLKNVRIKNVGVSCVAERMFLYVPMPKE